MAKMRTFRLDKLVRNGIVEGHEQEGGSCVSRQLDGRALDGAMRAKVREEVAELISAEERTLDEYGDAVQALFSLAMLDGLERSEILAQVEARAAEMGDFSDGIFVETVTVPGTSWLADYYRSNHDRFPEVTND